MQRQPHQPLSSSITDQLEASTSEHITAYSHFKRIAAKVYPAAIDQLDYRRERQVFLLTDGKRSIGQIAGLLRIPQIEAAQMMKRLLEMGYVEYIPSGSNVSEQMQAL